MKFLPIPFDKSCIQLDPAIYPKAMLNRYYVYEVIARLALLAAFLELEQNQQVP
jgi:glutamate--cysteine ligase